MTKPPLDKSPNAYEELNILVGWLASEEAMKLPLAELEDQIANRVDEMVRKLVRDHLDMSTEQLKSKPHGVVDADSAPHAGRKSDPADR